MSRLVLILVLLAVSVPAAVVSADTLQRVELSDRLADLEVIDNRIVVDGESLTPGDFMEVLKRSQGSRQDRGFLYKILDVTGPLGVLWVGLGLLGQVLFTGRLVVQWLVSEKERRSIVPPAFWWMSFGGAALLLAYFIWRTDIVGILGQSTGFFIYARNLWMIYFPKPQFG